MQRDDETIMHGHPGGVNPQLVRGSGPDSARSVLVLGTSAPAAKSLGNPEWVTDLEYKWRIGTERERLRLHERAKEMRRRARDVMRMELEYGRQDVLLPVMRVRAMRSAEWAEERARALAMERTDVIGACDERWRSIACGCGRRDVRVGCDQPQLCAQCRKRHAAKWWGRIAKGMERALKRERAEWFSTPAYRRRGMLPGIYLITLTAPHTGDIEQDRKRIGIGLRKLLKHANKYNWWRTYALTWEVTCGPTENAPHRSKDSAHVHVHLAAVSSWIPYRRRRIGDTRNDADCDRWDSESPNAGASPHAWRWRGKRRDSAFVVDDEKSETYVTGEGWARPRYTSERGLHDVWQEAVPGALQPDVSPPNRTRNEAESAGHYLAKYVTKGVDASGFTGGKAGELLVAFRNKRKVSTSAEFWDAHDPTCKGCNERYRMTEAPCSLQDIAPDSVLRSHAVRYRFNKWKQDELWAPWQWRAPALPDPEPRERRDRRNLPTRWRLPDKLN